MIFLQTNWIIAFVCAFVLYGAGKQNATLPGGGDYGLLWAGLSIAVSALAIHVFGGGWIFVLQSQPGLGAGIAIFRVLRER